MPATNQKPMTGGSLSESHGSAPVFRANTEIDECDVICPHCGEAYQAEGEDFSENEREETCESCGGRYVLYDEFTVTHHTRALPKAEAKTRAEEKL